MEDIKSAPYRREEPPPMPRTRLIPITTVIQAVSTISNGDASIPELNDALPQCYDYDKWMMYCGARYGLTEPIDGNPLNEFGGYNDRRDITNEFFNSCYWSDTGQKHIRHNREPINIDEFLMTKADGMLLAHALWEVFEPEQKFDVERFIEITKMSRKPLSTAEPLAFHKPLDNKHSPPSRWPWGNHHTELLGHLEAAAREFWTGYNPENAKATAPKSETVIDWLEARNVPGQKKKVSNQMAKAIASMLRPDDLPTGPRK